ncbi:MAG: hypothetical protein COA78_25030 [Blastopirellula sp.]|nr:MAG: hypothetical protein COA78_25030 [Blastopirellula sp.]
MLVLTRKQQEQIRIGDNITLTILKVKGKSIRIGIDAPKDIRVVRGELIDTVKTAASGDGTTSSVVKRVASHLDINEKLNRIDTKTSDTKIEPPKASQAVNTASAPQTMSDYQVLSFRLPAQEQVSESPGFTENRIKTMQDFMAKR